MSIRKADQADFALVQNITTKTIREIYPHYYAKGAVEYFLEHHTAENISHDIHGNCVFLCLNHDLNAVGTITVKNNEICRLFVLSQYQGMGYGRELLEFAEKIIFEKYDHITLDASLPAKIIYQKRGYSIIESNTIKVNYDDFLCYDIMTKKQSD